MDTEFDVVVVGGGLAGSLAALELARSGRTVAFIAPARENEDARTTALMRPSVNFLERLGLWSVVSDSAAALSTMRLVDGSRRLVRAPTTSFHAGEVGETAFAYNLPNATLAAAIDTALAGEESLTRFDSAATSARDAASGVTVELADGNRITAGLAVAADGRRSVLRRAAGIGARTWQYPQSALVTVFSHRVPHENISTEFHTEEGPFTQVPLPGNRSSLVWVMAPSKAEILLRLGPANLAERIEERMQSMLGAVTVEAPARKFPLSGLIAHRFGRGRIVLVGEAAHVFPPIGAQGLNLGVRDVEALSECLGGADRPATGWASVASAYDRARRLDVASRTVAVDLLNRSLLSSFLPVHLVRSAGLAVLAEAAPLRSILMREGMRPGDALRGLATETRGRLERLRGRGGDRNPPGAAGSHSDGH